MAATIVYTETSHESTLNFEKHEQSLCNNYTTSVVGLWNGSKWPSTFRTNKTKLAAYLYSFFNVVFNVADFLLFLPVKVRGRFTLFHLDNCKKKKNYSDEALNQSLYRRIVHFILPKYCRNLCRDAFEHWCKTDSFALQVLLQFTGFVHIHLNNPGKKSSTSTPNFA